jgi:hypothetical protein
VQVEREISVASLRREGWNSCDCECTHSENLQHHRGLAKVEVKHRERECLKVLRRSQRTKSSGGISPLVQLHRTKVGKLGILQEEENRRLELLEERSLQERAETERGHRASEYRGWRA